MAESLNHLFLAPLRPISRVYFEQSAGFAGEHGQGSKPAISRGLGVKTWARAFGGKPRYTGTQGRMLFYAREILRAVAMIEASKHDGSRPSAGDPLPPKCAIIEVHVAELKQLFNSIDPSPFRNRDLDPKAEEFIVGWAKDMPRDAPLALVVDLDRPAGLPDEAAVLRDAIHEFFRQRARTYWQRLRDLFRVGRTSLVIGLIALAAAIALGDFLASLMKGSRIGEIVRESLTIGGWVSMWRPLEIFLYDWWPVRREARLSDRLAAMPVRIRYMDAAAPESWRADWPAVSPEREHKEMQRATRTLNQAS